MPEHLLTPDQKALEININPAIYGTFAEIGAGQEVARLFFRVGGAAGTIAKSMSAYDMKFSDEIYGKVTRYVSKERLIAMLSHEYELLNERLSEARGKETTFFAFANTVAARNFQGTNQCHGWMGLRFQSHPGAIPNDIILHLRLKDKENVQQQQALGIVGVNLLYAAYNYINDHDRFIASLLDGLSIERLEIDIMELSGPDLDSYDDRVVSLNLLRLGLTNAVLFGPDRTVYQPSELLYKKPILVERGSFRPITHVNIDMLKSAQEQFSQLPEVHGEEIVTLLEITLENLLSTGQFDREDFLDRVDSVSALGYKVLVTNYPQFYLLPAYFRNYSMAPLAFVLGLNTLLQIFDENFYTHLEGGILNAFGRLFHSRLKLLVYPMSSSSYERYLQQMSPETKIPIPAGKNVIEAEDVLLEKSQQHLFAYLTERGYIQGLKISKNENLEIFSREILRMIKEKNPEWEKYVPEAAAKVIKERNLFD